MNDRLARVAAEIKNPSPATIALGEQIEAAVEHVHAWVESYYVENTPAFIAAHLGYPRFRHLQKIVADTIIAYDVAFSTGPSGEKPRGITHYPLDHRSGGHLSGPWNPILTPTAIITSRPLQRWPIWGSQTFETVAEVATEDIACDLRITHRCVEAMIHAKENDYGSYAVEAGASLNRPYTFPFAHGNTLVFCRFCLDCWQKFVERNGVGHCAIENPWEGLD